MSHEHSSSIEKEIADAVAAFTEAKDDGKITLREAFHVAAEVTHAACQVLCSLDNPITHKEELIRAAESAYDNYLAPLDIVGIPNDVIEPYIDGLLRAQIRPALSAIFDNMGE